MTLLFKILKFLKFCLPSTTTCKVGCYLGAKMQEQEIWPREWRQHPLHVSLNSGQHPAMSVFFAAFLTLVLIDTGSADELRGREQVKTSFNILSPHSFLLSVMQQPWQLNLHATHTPHTTEVGSCHLQQPRSDWSLARTSHNSLPRPDSSRK